MALFYLIRDDSVVDAREFVDAPPELAPNKGAWLAEDDDHPAVQAVAAEKVEAMRQAKARAISTQFGARAYALIDHAVGGTTYQFDADKSAIENLTGVLALINSGVLTTSRGWKPYGHAGILMAPADFVALVAAIATRKDALYQVKWTLEASLAAADADGVAAFDPASGWD